MTPSDQPDLSAHWLAAIARPNVRAALESIYAAAAAAIAARGPACWASGRCCNFEKHGHRLYVTGLEAAYCVVGRERGERQETEEGPQLSHDSPRLSLPQIDENARLGEPEYPRPACPFQAGNLCGVHAIKPLGCRVYFCDKSAQEWQMELSERLLARVRSIHDEFGIEYRYGEWREMLGRFGIDRSGV